VFGGEDADVKIFGEFESACKMILRLINFVDQDNFEINGPRYQRILGSIQQMSSCVALLTQLQNYALERDPPEALKVPLAGPGQYKDLFKDVMVEMQKILYNNEQKKKNMKNVEDFGNHEEFQKEGYKDMLQHMDKVTRDLCFHLKNGLLQQEKGEEDDTCIIYQSEGVKWNSKLEKAAHDSKLTEVRKCPVFVPWSPEYEEQFDAESDKAEKEKRTATGDGDEKPAAVEKKKKTQPSKMDTKKTADESKDTSEEEEEEEKHSTKKTAKAPRKRPAQKKEDSVQKQPRKKSRR